MDGVKLQSRLWKGYGKAAKRIGTLHTVYRPGTITTNPLIQANIVTQIQAVFAIHTAQFTFDKPSDYKDNLFHGLFDATLCKSGDYLVGDDGTYFITAFDPIKPTLCVQCSPILALHRPAQASGVGLGAYSGEVIATETTLFSGFPGGMVLRSQAERSEKITPSDAGSGSYEILLPVIGSGIVPRPSDILSDQYGRRYAVKTVEISELGWRIRVNELVT